MSDAGWICRCNADQRRPPPVVKSMAFQSWLDDFFTSYYRHQPVNATFIGIHSHDSSLPDYGENGAGDALADAESLLERLHDLPDQAQRTAAATDRRLAEGWLHIRRWELRSGWFHRRNPCAYTGEAIFGVISLLRRPFAPAEARLESALARMEAVPALLREGRENLRSVPLPWTERAIDECAGALELLRGGIDRFAGDHGISQPLLRRTTDIAAAAFSDFQHYLETDLRSAAAESRGCGDEALDLLLQYGHFLGIGADEVEAYASQQFDDCSAWLDSRAADFGCRSPREVLARLADLHPTVESYYGRYDELWQDCRARAEEHRLLRWPDYPIRYLPQPHWARAAAPHLYFLPYHSPAPHDTLPLTEYLVPPIEREMPPERQERLLRATNDSVIKLNHVVHHGAVGHHVQNWHAFRAASRIGRIAAVDCACRIALLCGGTMAEGWACYATDLMDEFGFLSPLEHYAQIHTRLRMAARAMMDVRLHRGRIGLEEAEAFYRERVGMAPAAARGEAVKNSMFPAAALMYLVGTDAIHRLRGDLAGRPGFELGAFHDRLLSFGSIPLALAAEMMRRDPLDGSTAETNGLRRTP